MTLSLTTEVTQKDYEAAIPKECSYETMQAHLDMMLCWGLKVSLEKGIPMDCTGVMKLKRILLLVLFVQQLVKLK
jgi:hypothetical protein